MSVRSTSLVSVSQGPRALRLRGAALVTSLWLASLALGCAPVEPSASPEPSAAGSVAEQPAASASSSAQLATSPAAASTSAPSAPQTVQGLRAEIVPVIGGLFPVRAPEPGGAPVPTSLVLRVHNTTGAPIMLRTGGDDQGIDLSARGPGVESRPHASPCPELYKVGGVQTIAAHSSIDLPLVTLSSGSRCAKTSLYLTKPGLYELGATLRAHVHDSADAAAGKLGKGERGEQVSLRAPTVHLRAG
jgi:hypothetical protein